MYRRSYADDPGLCDAVFELLATWIPALPEQRRLAQRLNWRWEDVSTPFVYTDDGRVDAHVGLLEMPLWLHGRPQRVGGVHAVCTRASLRRRGIYRALMDELLAYCEGRYATLVLSTETPPYFTGFGFRALRESAFVARRTGSGAARWRALELDAPADVALLDALLAARTPVSHVVGVQPEAAVFKFNQARGGLYYSDDLELLAVLEREPGQLVVRDLVGARLCSGDDLLRAFDGDEPELLLCFSPDRFALDARPAAVPAEEGVFMARGPFPAEGERFMLPPTARH